MPASRTTRTTSSPATPQDGTPSGSPSPDSSTVPETPDVTAPGPAALHGAATSTPAVDDTNGSTSPSKETGKGAAAATDPDGKTTRPRRRKPNPATTGGASGATIIDSAAAPDAAAPDAAAPDAAAPDAADAAEGGSPIEDDVWAALRKQPGATATELARSVPAGRKIVLAMLNRWCAEGSVDTTAGATARAATRYFALPSTLPTPAPASVPSANTEPELSTTAPATGVGEPPAAEPTLDTGPDADPAAPDAATAPSAEALTDAEPTAQPTADVRTAGNDADRADAARTNSSGSERLRSGALHGMVEDFLREHPADEHGPVAIAKSIGRSSGAVANALERMVGSGWAVRTSDRPKRYRIADATDNDARTETTATSEPPTPAHTPGNDVPAPDATAVDAPAVDAPAATHNGPGRGRGARAAGLSGTATDTDGSAAAASGSASTREGAALTRC